VSLADRRHIDCYGALHTSVTCRQETHWLLRSLAHQCHLKTGDTLIATQPCAPVSLANRRHTDCYGTLHISVTWRQETHWLLRSLTHQCHLHTRDTLIDKEPYTPVLLADRRHIDYYGALHTIVTCRQETHWLLQSPTQHFHLQTGDIVIATESYTTLSQTGDIVIATESYTTLSLTNRRHSNCYRVLHTDFTCRWINNTPTSP
jgi:hypothetical protein